MNVKRIVVDELPSHCNDCRLKKFLEYKGEYWCYAAEKQIYKVFYVDLDFTSPTVEETLNKAVYAYGKIDVIDITRLQNNLLQIIICYVKET